MNLALRIPLAGPRRRLDPTAAADYDGDQYQEIWEPIVKTTIEIANDLAREAKAHAARENLTLRELFERGLRMAMKADREAAGFRLRDASVDGRGLSPEFQEADWARLREAVYEGRGG